MAVITSAEKAFLRDFFNALRDEDFETACAQSDPYVAGLATILGAADVPATAFPKLSPGINSQLAVRWQLGRAPHFLLTQ